MQELIITEETIKNRIFTIRGMQVMFDSDLAKLYHIKAIKLREQVKRNISKFPKDFMFQLNENEVNLMVSQFAIPSKQYLGGYLPYVFTEQGVAMLSGVLKSQKAIEINIQIIRAFIAMRKFIASNAQIFQRLDHVEIKLINHDKKIEKIFNALENKTIPNKGIFFEGQIFDAYNFVADLIRNANQNIILIDNYVDDSVLTLFKKRKENVKVLIYTKLSKQLELDLKKFNSQYENLKIRQFDKAHDRFLIIDDQVYHFGASLKDLGKKWFAFSKFDREALAIMDKLSLTGD